MKHRSLWVLVLFLLALLVFPVSNLVVGGPRNTPLTRGAHVPEQARVASLLEKKCAHCHVAGVRRPFYARLPLASSLMQGNVKEALEHVDFGEAFGDDKRPVPEPVLAKIEKEVREGGMPPLEYRLLHWNAWLSQADRALLQAWIVRLRSTAHALPDYRPEVRAGVIRPLPRSVQVDSRKAALGRKLYHDPRLSGDNTISCASCHDLNKGGTDQQVVSDGIRGQLGAVNAPTTFNSGLQVKQFWDGRAADLKEQAAGPPLNPVEMGSSWAQIVEKLSKDAALTAECKAVYPGGWSRESITDAIATFEQTLITPGSRLDKFLLGDQNALTAEEKRGYDKFLEVGCATCHVGELLGGKSFEKMGQHADYFASRGGKLTEADLGRFKVTKQERDRHRFKVPTLRNVARTAPYFHDGSIKTLAEAIRSMARHQLGLTLADPDVAALAKFLESLSGEYEGKAL